MQVVLPCSSGMVSFGTRNTVDAQRHVGGALTCLSGMGVDGAHNSIGKMSAPTTLLGFFYAREVVGYCPTGVQGTFFDITVDLGALLYFFHTFPGPYRLSVTGRLVPVGSDCANRRRAVSRGLAHPRLETRVGVGKWCLARPSGRRGHSEVGRCQKRELFLLCEAFWWERRARVRSGRRSSLARPSSQRLDYPSGPSFRCLGRPMSCVLFTTLSAGPSLCWEAGP